MSDDATSSVGPSAARPRARPRRRAPRNARTPGSPAPSRPGAARLARGDQRQQHLDRVLVLVGLAVGAQQPGRLRQQRRDERRVSRDLRARAGSARGAVARPEAGARAAAGVVGRDHQHALGHDDAGEQLAGQRARVAPAGVRRHHRVAARRRRGAATDDQGRRLGRDGGRRPRIEHPRHRRLPPHDALNLTFLLLRTEDLRLGRGAASLGGHGSGVRVCGISSAIVTPAIRCRRPSSSSPTSLTNTGAVVPCAISMSLERNAASTSSSRWSMPARPGT